MQLKQTCYATGYTRVLQSDILVLQLEILIMQLSIFVMQL